MKKFFLIDIKQLEKKKYFVKFIEEIKDEIILFIDKEKKIRIFSSICPHFGGEIYFDFKNDCLRCKWHDWKFSKDDGKCISFPIKGKLKDFEFGINPKNLKEFKFDLIDDGIYLTLSNE